MARKDGVDFKTGRLEEVKDRLTRELPLGWRQRLALGCALLHRPPIVFLDEPTSGVDPVTRRNFWDLIYALADEGVTLFVTTHYMEEVEKLCTRAVIMNEGELLLEGAPKQLVADAQDCEDLTDVFLKHIRKE